jgi:hypothetical protein
MPSEPQQQAQDRTAAARAALKPARDRYRSIVAATVEQVRPTLKRAADADGTRAGEPADTLGALGAKLIDLDRFRALTPRSPREDGASEPVEHAFDTLTELLAEGDAAFEVEVTDGQTLHAAVDAGLRALGRAFGAARVIDLAQAGRYEADEHAALLEGVPFARWNQAEREVAPPLLVRVPGAQLAAGGLADFLDGGTQLLLVVDGEAPLAPLAPLITPGRLVQQAEDAGALALSGWQGPAIAALVRAPAALFLHDPGGGASYFERIRVDALPDDDKARRVGTTTASADVDALAHLRALTSETVEPAVEDEASSDNAEARLAAWLLKQARL